MDTVGTLFDSAAADRRHGAAEIESRLVDGLLGERRQWTVDGLARGARQLLLGQPLMANLRHLARSLDGDLTAVERRLELRARVLRELDERLAEAAWSEIRPSRRLLTISRSSAVASALIGAWHRGWRGETVVFDGTEAGRGRDQARALAEVMAGVRSQPDATMSGWLSDRAVRVVIGADAVSELRLVNVCGTATLLELARARSIPVVVVADSGKDLPDHELDELLECGPLADEAGVDRCWPIFEAVPRDLVTTRVRE